MKHLLKKKLVATCLPLLMLALGGCVTPAFDHTGVQTTVAPWQAIEQSLDDIDVIWGGVIVKVHHFEDMSEVEVLAYPLDRGQRPLPSAPTQGRFRIRVPGYVEREDFPEGLFLSARGHLIGSREGNIGKARYRYPIIGSAQIRPWPPGFQFDGLHLSVGVGVYH